MALLLTQDDLTPLVTDPQAWEGAFQAVEEAYREFQRGATQHVETVGVPLTGEQRSLRICPGFAAGGAAIRTYPVAGRGGQDSSVNLLYDPATGQLLALVAGDDLNMFRTAAPAGVAVRYLAPPRPHRVAMLGSGRQARGLLRAAYAALPTLEQSRAYSPNSDHRTAYAREMRDRAGIAVEAVDDPREAVEGADVVLITSNSRRPVLEADWVRPGACVISISGGQVPSDLVERSRVTVASRADVVGEGARREPYTSMIASGAWSAADVAAEIGEIILGQVPARVRDDQVVLHEMPGLSFWDAAILSWAYQWAVANEAGTEFHLSSALTP